MSLRPSAAWRVHALGAASGALYFLAFPPYSLRPLAWLALVPLVLAVRRATRLRQALSAGALAALVACLGGYFWIADTAHRFWEVPWAFAILLLSIFGTFAELHFTLFAALLWKLRQRLAARPAALVATLFLACEMLVPRIFPDKLGHTTLDIGGLPFAAGLAGVHGLSFVLAWLAASAAALLDRGAPRRRARATEMILALVTFAVLWGWGARQSAALAAAPASRTLDVVIVQSNIGDPEELAKTLGSVTQAIDSTIATYAGLTLPALAESPADLVVWPETAVPSVPRPRAMARVQAVAETGRVPIVFGAYDTERVAPNRWKLYNAAFLMMQDGELRDRYYKHKLLVFGEYVPLSERFPVLLDILPTPGQFTPGPGPRVFRVHDVALTPLICYELLFPGVVRASLRAGGEVIVNMTNDYWFGRHIEPYQHLELSRMAAIEVARPIVRATNTGISAIIDHRGRVLQRSGLWTQEVVRGRVAVPDALWTPFARWGAWATWGLAALALAASGLAWGLVRDAAPAPARPIAVSRREGR